MRGTEPVRDIPGIAHPPHRTLLSRRQTISSSLRSIARAGPQSPGRLAVRDHDFAEMTAALEMAVGFLSLGEWECPVDHRPEPMQRDSPVHRLEMRAASDADRPDGYAAPGQQ